MTAVSTTVWNDIIGHFRVNHPPLVRGWFCELKPSEIDSGVLSVQASNRAQFRYLEQHCRLPFAEAAQAATGRLLSVSFEADGDDDDYPGAFLLPFDMEDQLNLNDDYTFENFVTGPNNRLAHAAALAVAKDLGQAYNPFFVYGPVGLGKTHLLQAICNAVRKRDPQSKCLYISCESFINHFIEAVERGALHRFRYRYRHVDVLIIDDIQFLADRERSQEEFFHTFNTLHQSQKQVVLSANCSPSEIPNLEERLVSRFNSGLVALMDRPCPETRMAIVHKKAKLRCINVPDDVVTLIANNIDSNVRDLEGALIKLDALSQTRDGNITIDLAREVLGLTKNQPVNIPDILRTVAQQFDVQVADLQGKKRSRAFTYPRHIGMYLARSLTSQSLEEIGSYFGGRDHTTVMHANRTISQQVKQNKQLSDLLDEIANRVKNGSG